MSDNDSFEILRTGEFSSFCVKENEQRNEKSSIQTPLATNLNNGKVNSIRSALASASKPLTEKSVDCDVWKRSVDVNAATQASLNSFQYVEPDVWKRSTTTTEQLTISNNEGELQMDNMDVREEKNTGAIPKVSIVDGQKSQTDSKDSLQNNMAVSYIMGQVPADTLKASIHSQFPSVSLEACEELTTVMSDYLKMKDVLISVNSKMSSWLEMKKQMQASVVENRQKMNQCQEQIATLRNENLKIKQELDTKIEQLQANEAVRKQENEELIKKISEKSAIIANMRAQIEKLELQQLSSFEVVSKFGQKEKQSEKSEYVTRHEHERVIKDFERNMSQLLAEKLEISDMQKQYIDEINCLKVNLTASEEMVNQLRSDIALLKANDKEKTDQFELYALQRDEMREELGILRQQVDVYSRDFQLERTAREEMAGEKVQLLDDLRSLQHKNQALSEQVAKLEEHLAVISMQTNSPVAPSRNIVPPPAPVQAAAEHKCPICAISCTSLTSLQEHVNQCLDRNVHT
ncbi:NF-kappa-B essential modulator [Ceratitis capitata]|uniref:(Mediterranean fruit fly) hypothetical protein n=1 Tax=Ceratitis capitata TaxID=7213 RepID=A0A811VE47_CERCA|nr:NF-kappa-B essential modulator [Ceratitis capitata]CAD7014155.1 unnamed protein product [Ceratitis capitata]